jgi:hypothetical protein
MWEYLYHEEFWTWKLEITHLGLQSWLIPLFASLFVKKWTPVHLRILTFVVFSILMEHLSTDHQIEDFFHETSNAPWYHLLVPILFLLMSNLFLPYLITGRYSWLRWSLPLAFFLIALPGIFDEVDFYEFPGLTVGLYSILGILIILTYFFYLLDSLTAIYLERLPMFWVASGLLIYLSGNFLLWVSIVVVEFDNVFFNSIYRLNGGFTILLNCFLTIALLINPQSENKTPTT